MIFSESDTLFKIWDYTVSHRTMIIRSDAEPELGTTTRIEIYIGHVESMWLDTFMYGLTMHRPSEAEHAEISSMFSVEGERRYFYLLESKNRKGFIVGGRPSWREAVREIDEPTLFDFSLPWPPGPDIKWGDVE